MGMTPRKKISPSQFMRGLRPQYYSDTEDRVLYVLDAATLDHHLETITSRNETHDFELFARKLCERAICPNLRPSTGPEGGGDSKADSETLPVADEISRFYIGAANGGREKWAFAFSAKKTWSQKVRDDVAGIISTKRPYERIFCVTARYARDKDRARIEQELTNKHNVPVTILDRSWIRKEVIENDKRDLAFNYLKIGQAKEDRLQLGPADYSRERQLTAIEDRFADPGAFEGMERQRVSEALVAAKLSRSLERPRVETEGRFARAIRLANEDGSFRQKLESQYENLRTAYWWFDDVSLLNDSYDAFEAIALRSNHTANLEFLCNLFQLLATSVVHQHLTRSGAKLDERADKLRKALAPLAADRDRPNNRLEAELCLLIIRQNFLLLDNQYDNFSEIWRGYIDILSQAEGLGEFDAKRLLSMIEATGGVAGNDPEYNQLVERVADFVSNRSSEAEGALVLLKRAQQLDFSDRIDMIRLLGKAVIGLTKKEHAEQIIEALHLLMLAYRGAGLLWAARATCTMAAASIVMEGEEDSLMPVSFVPTMVTWGWIAVQLRHVPDLLLALQILDGALNSLPLADESKEKLGRDVQNLEYSLGSIILNLSDQEISLLVAAPDVLERLGLFMARSALLYSLGHYEVLREDGSVPSEESDEDVARMFSILASQPVSKEAVGPLIVNGMGSQRRVATVLGMTIEVIFDGNDLLTVVAEVLLGSIEAFFATAIDQKVFPHTERFSIALQLDIEASEPAIDVNELAMKATVKWPESLRLTQLSMRSEAQKFFALASSQVLGVTCVIDDVEGLLKKLLGDEAVGSRMIVNTAAVNSYHRVAARYLSRLSDWRSATDMEFAIRTRPQVTHLDIPKPDDEDDDGERAEIPTDGLPKRRSHRAVVIRSVIDVHAWNKAGWKAIFYFLAGPDGPPCMAFTFEDEEAGRSIFERWRERVGSRDMNDDIYISVIRRLTGQPPAHYIVLVASKPPEPESRVEVLTATRSMTMTPDNSVNLDRFLEAYKATGMYYILPATLQNDEPNFVTELAIAKRGLSVTDASDVRDTDIETLALKLRE